MRRERAGLSVTWSCLGLGGDGRKLHLVSGSRQLKLGHLLFLPPSAPLKEAATGAALLAFSLCFSEGGFYLALILVDSLYGLEDRYLAVASFANALRRSPG
jgi:hypothetical protein